MDTEGNQDDSAGDPHGRTETGSGGTAGKHPRNDGEGGKDEHGNTIRKDVGPFLPRQAERDADGKGVDAGCDAA